MNSVFPIFCCISIISVSAILLPMTKTDGTLDVSSLMSHIALLEQTIEDKASAVEVAQLKSDLAASQKELEDTKSELNQVKSDLAVTTSKLDITTEELRDVKNDLKNAEIEIAVLKFQDNRTETGVSQVTSNMTTLTSDVAQLKTEVFQLQSLSNKSGGATFTRWGRTACPADSRVVYKGYTGGTHYSDTASSASILCLSDQPIYANYTPTGHDDSYGSHIFGAEYETRKGDPFESLADADMPCVVCQTNGKSSAVMVPGRNQCHPGWTLEYWGYLMGPSFNYASGEYICVDTDAEAIPGSWEDKDGQVFYPVEGRCEPLPCPPYHDHWELTCAVCSK